MVFRVSLIYRGFPIELGVVTYSDAEDMFRQTGSIHLGVGVFSSGSIW